ncbi:MAG: hypothetical protein KGZ63_01110 [Clostridiales bacterium]|jgi:predicted RNA-binding Zn-ribbon protein involved in translation (DUF1610 family)|nr:hypothetical protein [Clostridiales bacterium]
MEKLGGQIEFLCLTCGVQGLCSADCPESVGELSEMILCPKCGDHVVTTHLYRKERASLVLTV